MPEFEYTAREMSGAIVTGTLEAGSEQEVLSSLAGRSLFPTKVLMAGQAAAQQKSIGRRIPSRLLAMFFSQLADLLHSGVPLLRSLELLERQASAGSKNTSKSTWLQIKRSLGIGGAKQALGAVLQDLRGQVADGTRLADAMRKHPRAFNELAVSMVRAGEEGGFLEDVLKRVAMFTEHQEDMKSKVVGALVYPAFLMVVGVCVVTIVIVYFVPKFAPIFERQAERGQLPWATIALMQFSKLLTNYGLWVLAALVAAVWWVWNWAQSDKGRYLFDKLRLQLPGLGPIVRSLGTARFCRILGTMLKNGVPLLLSLRIAKDATGNRLLSDAIGHAADNVTAGKSLARPLATSGQFGEEIVEMIAVGEEANNLEDVLVNVSENLERNTYRQLEMAVKLIEPIMLIVMAVAILFVVVALLLPVFQGANSFN